MAKIIAEQADPNFLEKFISVFQNNETLWKREDSKWCNTIKRADLTTDIGKQFNISSLYINFL